VIAPAQEEGDLDALGLAFRMREKVAQRGP